MTAIDDIKRRLETAVAAIEATDAALEAGTLDAETHGRRRAEQEREAGRLFVELRRTQRARRPRTGEVTGRAAPAGTPWFRTPPALAGLAFVLLVAGVGAGLGIAALSRSPAAPPAVAGATDPAVGQLTLEALRRAGLADTSIPGVLEQAHAALDGGKLAEARRLYDQVLARDPRNAEAISHLGAVLYQEGRVDAALAKVDEALRIDPRYIHALWDRVHYLAASGRDAAAVLAAGDAFLAVVPTGSDAEKVRALMLKARAAGAKPGS